MKTECTICYEYFDPRSVISGALCGHTFHQTCLLEWIKRNRSCPKCRMPTYVNSIIPRLFFDFGPDLPPEEDPEILKNEIMHLRMELVEKKKEIELTWTPLYQIVNDKYVATSTALEQQHIKYTELKMEFQKRDQEMKRVITELEKENQSLQRKIEEVTYQLQCKNTGQSQKRTLQQTDEDDQSFNSSPTESTEKEVLNLKSSESRNFKQASDRQIEKDSMTESNPKCESLSWVPSKFNNRPLIDVSPQESQGSPVDELVCLSVSDIKKEFDSHSSCLTTASHSEKQNLSQEVTPQETEYSILYLTNLNFIPAPEISEQNSSSTLMEFSLRTDKEPPVSSYNSRISSQGCNTRSVYPKYKKRRVELHPLSPTSWQNVDDDGCIVLD